MNPAFVESVDFTRDVVRLGLDDELRYLQWSLRLNPDAGVLERGTGGLRKVRLGDRSRSIGKRGGARVHYLHVPGAGVIYLLSVYAKRERATLSNDHKRVLRALARRLRSMNDADAARQVRPARKVPE